MYILNFLVVLCMLHGTVPVIIVPPPSHDFLRQRCDHRRNLTDDRGNTIESIKDDEDCLYQFLLDSDHQDTKDIHSFHDRPPNQKDLNITVEDFHIQHIELPKDSSYQFRVYGYIQVGWSDSRLKWDPEAWNIEVMFLQDIHRVWTPSLVDEQFCPVSSTCIASYQDIEVASDGSVVGLMQFQYSAFCSIDYRNYPEDRNDCFMIFSGFHAGFSANFHVSNEGERRKTRPKVVLESISKNHDIAELTNEHTPWVVFEEKMEVQKTPIFESFRILKLTLRAERKMPTLSVALRFPVTLVTMLMLVSPLFGDLRTQAFVKLLCFGLQTICFIFLCSIAPQNGFGGTKPHIYSYYESVFALTALSIFITIGCMALSRAKRTVPPSHRVYLAAKLVNRAICCIEPENAAHYSRYLEDHENQSVSSEVKFRKEEAYALTVNTTPVRNPDFTQDWRHIYMAVNNLCSGVFFTTFTLFILIDLF